MDVHTHLTHEDFSFDLEGVISQSKAAGLGAIVVNGLEPQSNRSILNMALRHAIIKPALGIYPIDAVCHHLPRDFPFKVRMFNVQEELEFIKTMAMSGKLHAIGECGLDGHWLDARTFKAQEEAFESLLETAVSADLPVIIHSRKREKRVIEILKAFGARKVNFHCYGGRTKIAVQVAYEHGWYFSIPANARSSEAFQKLLKELPPERILTETDAPYLPPIRKTRNAPASVIHTVNLLASLREWDLRKAKSMVWENYLRLFAPNPPRLSGSAGKGSFQGP